MRAAAWMFVALAIGGCAAKDKAVSRVGAHRQAIVNGTVSVPAQDATVMLVDQGRPACTGTLIAPNLVLTARHCVEESAEGADQGGEGDNAPENECTGFGTQFAATGIGIAVGVNASPSNVVANGKRIFVPQTSNMCSFDVALIQTDRDVTGAKIAKVRFSELALNEKTVAVGFGVDGNDREPTQRMQRETTILGVGPKSIQYLTKQNENLVYNIPQGDVATGESTCFGDSGGPLFDMQGAVVAITSRGIPNSPEGGAHGNGCIDAPSVFAGVKFNESIIREAAKAVGHPLQVVDAPGVPPPSDEPAEDEEAGAEDEEEESAPVSKKSKKKRDEDDEEEETVRVPQASAGCSSGGRSADPSFALVIVAISGAVGGSRRFRRRTPGRTASSRS